MMDIHVKRLSGPEAQMETWEDGVLIRVSACGGQRLMSGAIPQALFILFFEARSLLDLELISLGRLVGGHQVSACICFPKFGIKPMYICLKWVLEIKFRSLCLHSKNLTCLCYL